VARAKRKRGKGALAQWSVAWGGSVAARIGKEAGAGN
jgi:hypothetical protein